MLKNEFLKYLSMQENKTITFTLKGIIYLKIEIKNVRIKYDENYITIENKEKSVSNIKLNLHQLMKISKEESQIILEFDQLQSVIITIKEEVL